jgi:hypothetical protein
MSVQQNNAGSSRDTNRQQRLKQISGLVLELRVDFDAMCGGDFRSTFYVGARWAKGNGNTEIRTVQSTRQKKRHNDNNKNNKIRTGLGIWTKVE